jgi:hypothetical protein
MAERETEMPKRLLGDGAQIRNGEPGSKTQARQQQRRSPETAATHVRRTTKRDAF